MAIGVGAVENTTAKMTSNTDNTSKNAGVSGRTIGEPKLSDTASKYYEQLKKKYANYDFILVSKDQKEQAMANASKYANKDRTVVLIDEEKIEKMATDEKYRKKYENILSGASAQLEQLKKSLSNASNIKGFGIQVNDNGATSFFAAVDKNMSASRKMQEKRIEKKAQEKAAAKKKEAKQAQEKRLEKAKESKASNESGNATDDVNRTNQTEDVEVVSASSIDELLKKIQAVNYAAMSDQVMTDYERAVGGNIDFKG
ncbi:MAG: DUF6033 family protein [bacterium]|nr:DUF6033 family protein [bacterium]